MLPTSHRQRDGDEPVLVLYLVGVSVSDQASPSATGPTLNVTIGPLDVPTIATGARARVEGRDIAAIDVPGIRITLTETCPVLHGTRTVTCVVSEPPSVANGKLDAHRGSWMQPSP